MDTIINGMENLNTNGVENRYPLFLNGYFCVDINNDDFEFIIYQKNGISNDRATDCILDMYGIENVLCEAEIFLSDSNSFITYHHWEDKIPHELILNPNIFPVGFWISEPKINSTLESIGSVVFRDGGNGYEDMFKKGNLGEVEFYSTFEATALVI